MIYLKPVVMLAFITAILIIFLLQRADNAWFLIIQDPRSDAILFEIPVEPGDTFTLSYIHSVSRLPVEGTFLLTGTGLIEPLTTSYTAYGPGLPVERYENWQIENGIITVYHEEEPRRSIRLWATCLSQETLVVADRVLPLYNEGQNSLVEIYVITRPPF